MPYGKESNSQLLKVVIFDVETTSGLNFYIYIQSFCGKKVLFPNFKKFNKGLRQ